MTLEVRRIVTGHDAAGKAIVASDERMQAAESPTRPGISRVEIWSTDRMPVDNSEGAAAEAQRKGFVVRHNYVDTGQGTVVPSPNSSRARSVYAPDRNDRLRDPAIGHVRSSNSTTARPSR